MQLGRNVDEELFLGFSIFGICYRSGASETSDTSRPLTRRHVSEIYSYRFVYIFFCVSVYPQSHPLGLPSLCLLHFLFFSCPLVPQLNLCSWYSVLPLNGCWTYKESRRINYLFELFAASSHTPPPLLGTSPPGNKTNLKLSATQIDMYKSHIIYRRN